MHLIEKAFIFFLKLLRIAATYKLLRGFLNMKKHVFVSMGCGFAFLVLLGLAGAWSMFGEFVKSANSITKYENGLYTMNFEGDYGFDDFLAQGGASSDKEVADFVASYLSHGFYKIKSDVQTGEFGCSTICAKGRDGAPVFGRNFDWKGERAIIVHTKPKNGFESISTCCIDFLGFSKDYQPDGSMMERIQTLGAIYVPLDGMNSRGLMVADLMAGDDEVTRQDTGKVKLTTTTAIRLLLDKASTVDEAVKLLAQYDMNSSIKSAHHLSIADKNGKSVVVEYVNGEMLVTETKVVTNHYLSKRASKRAVSENSRLRFERLSAYNSIATEAVIKNLLESVTQKHYPGEDHSPTMWSIVYRPSKMQATFYYKENFSHSYNLRIGE